MASFTAEHPGRPAELLLVEDNHGDVLLTREAFRSARVANNLTVAIDGEEALSMLRREGPHANRALPDLILLDLNLPRMDGRDVLRAVKADAALRRIPVIVLTGARAGLPEASDLEADGYIAKPIDFEHLKEVVAPLESFWFAVMVRGADSSAGSTHV
jgi:chemotaxis family two-component system response regulator Rcp1